MLRIHFSREDVARTRVAPGADPVWELILSLHFFQARRPDRDPLLAGWRREVVAGLRHSGDGDSVRLLFALNPPLGYFPDFLTPFESRAGLLPGLDAIRSTPTANLRRDLTLLAEGNNRLPPGVSALARGDSGALHRLTETMESYRALAIAPYWSRIESAVEADRGQRGRAMLADGADGLLASLRPAMRWDGEVLEVRHYPANRDLYLDGRGLLLVPAFFCARTPVTLVDPDLPPVLVYPVERLGGLDQPSEPARSALAALLGRTRARVLEVVDGGCSTGEIARRLDISAAAASQHTAVLRNAGLLVSRRDGNTMLHTLTPLGRAMLD